MYRVLRHEHRVKNEKNECFIHLEITDETFGVFHRAEWLTLSETNALLEDGSLLQSITDGIYNRALLARPQQIVQEQQAHELELARQQNDAAQAQLQLASIQLEQSKVDLQIAELQAGIQLE